MSNVYSRFAVNPTDTTIRRSKMDQPHSHKTTFNAGKLVPIELIECLPGSTYSMNLKSFVRMSTPVHPVMDDCYMDVHFYFVPMRLVWDNFEKFMGASAEAWTQPVEYLIPQISFPNLSGKTGFKKGSVADHFGIPTNVSGGTFNALPFRCYALIWNQWYRDQNLQDEILINKGDARVRGDQGLNDDFLTTAQLGGALCPVAKYHDYFTSALPDPQKGPDVLIPLGESTAQVQADGPFKLKASSQVFTLGNFSSNNQVPQYGDENGTYAKANTLGNVPLQYADGLEVVGESLGPTVNQLRQAFGLQTLYEKDALYGTRYTEILRGHFQTVSPDFRLQRAEFIGGRHFRLNMSQVLQTSSTDATSPQGNTAAFSATADADHVFTYSCVEHGYIIGLAMVRNAQSYQQGMDKLWLRERRFEYFWPELGNLGNLPVYNGEIFYSGDTNKDKEVFGYQEAWADYRYKPSKVTGAFRSNYEGSLDVWHYADYYTARPVLGDEWIRATSQNIDRTLAVSSSVEDQFLCEFQYDLTAVLPMPLYSMGAALGRH